MCICAVYLDSESFTKLAVFDREYTNFADAVNGHNKVDRNNIFTIIRSCFRNFFERPKV